MGRKLSIVTAFSVYYTGHLQHLQAAKEIGDTLVVTVALTNMSDKGPRWSVYNQRVRIESIVTREVADCVAVNEASSAIATILYVKNIEYQDLTGRIGEEKRAIDNVGGEIAFVSNPIALLSKCFSIFRSIKRKKVGRNLAPAIWPVSEA